MRVEESSAPVQSSELRWAKLGLISYGTIMSRVCGRGHIPWLPIMGMFGTRCIVTFAKARRSALRSNALRMRTSSVSNIHQRKQKFWISRAGNETRCYLRRLPPRGADQGGHLPADHGAGRLAHGLHAQ